MIANDTFGDRSLPTARADGDLVAKTLREAGFDVLLIQNMASADLPNASKAIETQVTDSDLSMLYFTGVGSVAGGDVVLEPTDAGAPTDAPKGLPVRSLVGVMRAHTKSAVLVLDGVPAPAMAGEAVKPLKRGVPPETGAPSVLVSYSGAAGAPAVGDSAGANGVFATIFANILAQPGIPMQQVFRDLRRGVREATRGAQLPSAEGEVAADVIVRPVVEDPITSQPRPGLDQIFWTLIKGSADEADFKLFQSAFPASSYAERAAARQIALANSTATDVGRLTRSVTGALAAAPKPADTDQSLALGASIDRAPLIQVRTWPLALPKTPDGLATLAKSCDEVAGDPDDPMRLTPGIQWSMVNLRVAVRACIVDLARDPQNRRLLYQVGRLLDMLNLPLWAESFYRDAAKQGYAAAYANLAYLFMTGRGRPADMAAAMPYLRLGADLGNPRCRTDLGFAYLNGNGVPKSPQEAVLWIRLAAGSGWPNALDILANMYMNGNGVEKDAAAAFSIFQAAAWVGNTNAMSSLGRRYLEGGGTARDPAMARVWFERSIGVGNPFAPLYLGIMYRDGDGIPKDPAKAATYIRLSAERGFGEARLRLGELYEKGLGVPKDLESAAFNYALTDRQTFEIPVNAEFVTLARQKLKALSAKLTPAQLDAVKRRVDEYTRLNGA